MPELLNLPPDVQIILAMTIFFIAVRITDPWGKGPTRNVTDVVKSLLPRRQKSSSDGSDQDKPDQEE